jgi:hypothetical protein
VAFHLLHIVKVDSVLYLLGVGHDHGYIGVVGGFSPTPDSKCIPSTRKAEKV